MKTPVIIINGQAITRFELSNTMQEYAEEMHEAPVDALAEEDREELLQTSLERLVTWELIYQHSLADGATVADAELEAELDEIAAQFASREEMEAELTGTGADMALLRRSVHREILVERVLDGWFDAVPEPTAAEVETGYQEYLSGDDDEEPAETDAEGAALSREEVEPMIREHLRQIAGTERIRAWVDGLREQAEIEYLVNFEVSEDDA